VKEEEYSYYIFGSGVSREPYKSLGPFFCCSAPLLSSFVTNF